MNTQVNQASIEQIISFPLHSIKGFTEVSDSEPHASAPLIELNEREEFVKRIEAFCDCV